MAQLHELFDGDRIAVTRLLEAALASILNSVAGIESSAALGDTRTVVEAAHSLQGTSGSIGAQCLIELSSRIEAAAKAMPKTVASTMLLDLRESVELVKADIVAYCSEPR